MKHNLQMPDKPAEIIFKDCMNLKSKESCLVVCDYLLKDIGFSLFRNSLKITKKSKIVFVSIPKNHGTEPSKDVARQMLDFDVILLATTKSLSHTRARKNASKKGARIASMPGITKEMLERALNVDFDRIKTLNHKLISTLKNKNVVRITTKKEQTLVFAPVQGSGLEMMEAIQKEAHSEIFLQAKFSSLQLNTKQTESLLPMQA